MLKELTSGSSLPFSLSFLSLSFLSLSFLLSLFLSFSPSFLSFLKDSPSPLSLLSLSLSFRHMGAIRRIISEEEFEEESLVSKYVTQVLLFVEMCARTIREKINHSFRYQVFVLNFFFLFLDFFLDFFWIFIIFFYLFLQNTWRHSPKIFKDSCSLF